jgi:glycosyltransferase involved in cell wall biosynthesis
MTVGRATGISVVIPISSALYEPYLRNCLASLEAQSVDRGMFDVTVAYIYNRQYVESSKPIDGIVQLCMDYDAALVFHSHSYPDFPLALARNVGGRRTMRKVIGFIDSDLVLDPETFEAVLDMVPDKCKAACVHVHRMDQRPEDAIYGQFRKEVFRENLKLGRFDKAGKGGCFFIDATLFRQIRGFDERIWGWGAEDDDMWRRLANARIQVAHLMTEGILAMHQFHDHRDGFDHRAEENRGMMAMALETARNPSGWGGIRD